MERGRNNPGGRSNDVAKGKGRIPRKEKRRNARQAVATGKSAPIRRAADGPDALSA